MIEHVVGHLVAHGVDDVVLSLGYQPDGFRDAYPDGRCAGRHPALRHRARAARHRRRHPLRRPGRRDRRALPRGQRRRAHRPRRHAPSSPSTTPAAPRAPSRCTGSTTPPATASSPPTPSGRVSAFVEKPPRGEAPSDLINAGTYVLEPSVIDRIPAGRRVSIERETFPAMVADGSLYACADGCYWIDTGTPCEYIQAQLDLIDGVRGDAGRRRPSRRRRRRRGRGQAFGRRRRRHRRPGGPGRERGAAARCAGVLRAP